MIFPVAPSYVGVPGLPRIPRMTFEHAESHLVSVKTQTSALCGGQEGYLIMWGSLQYGNQVHLDHVCGLRIAGDV
jgi:hypothetical protein